MTYAACALVQSESIGLHTEPAVVPPIIVNHFTKTYALIAEALNEIFIVKS